MKKFTLSLFVITIVLLLSLVLTSHASAAPNDNSIFITLQKVQTLLEKLHQSMIGLRNENALVKDRVEDLEAWTENHMDEPHCATCSAEIAAKVVHEEVAMDALLSISLAQAKFQKDDTDKDGTFDYAETLDQLFASGSLIDNVLGTGRKMGYTYTLQVNPNQNGWVVIANPIKPGKTGDRSFYIDETGVIRASASAGVKNDSSPIEN